MKIDTQIKQNDENQEVSVQMKPEDAEVLTAANLPFSDYILQQVPEENNSVLNGYISKAADYNFNSVSVSLEDALFFVNLTREGQFSIENTPDGNFQSIVKLEVSQNVLTQKTVDVTGKITELIQKAQSTQKPVRISFDNNVSVVIKIDKHGKISAEFIPGSIEVENYLKNNISALKQRFDEQNLPYNDLLYRQNNKQNRNKNNKKESDNA